MAAKSKDKAFLGALVLSALFHLSMVTLFSIVIVFPIAHIEYYQLPIVPDPTASRIGGAGETPGYHLGSLDRPIELDDVVADAPEDAASRLLPELPAIELPIIEFAGLERLEIRERGLDVQSRFQNLLAPTPQDSWARFSEELSRLGRALSSMSLFEGEEDTAERDRLPVPKLVSRPASGYEAYLEWMNGPRDRQLIYAPPIEALWDVRPDRLQLPITFVLTVDPEGQVMELLAPVEDEAGIVREVAKALWRYRFVPIESGSIEEQRATVLIRAAEAGSS